MPYRLSDRSKSELDGVHPALVQIVEWAIDRTPVDFAVHDGLRTDAEQAEYVRRGVSQTQNSKHLRQADGYGHAVDLVPYINGKLRWEEGPCCRIAEVMRDGADRFGTRIRWGGAWVELNGTYEKPEELVRRYVERKRAAGQRAFLDFPHFELLW